MNRGILASSIATTVIYNPNIAEPYLSMVDVSNSNQVIEESHPQWSCTEPADDDNHPETEVQTETTYPVKVIDESKVSSSKLPPPQL